MHIVSPFLHFNRVALGADDVVVAANLVLRQNNPKLKPWQWTSLIADTVSIGERSMAVKLARQARDSCGNLSRRVRSAPGACVLCRFKITSWSHAKSFAGSVAKHPRFCPYAPIFSTTCSQKG